jgi:N-acetylglutamate synthase-like GNAT family acetyltransferase
MKIRVARQDDAKDISQLISCLTAKFITDDFSPEGKDHLISTMTPQAIESFMQSGYRYQLAEKAGKLVGVSAIKDNKHLYHLFVSEHCQREGIARQLWESAMKDCLSRGNPGAFTVNSSQYARGVYKKLGFVELSGPKEHQGVVFFPMKLSINNHQ